MSQQIIIFGKTYNVKADASGIDPAELAEYVDTKMHELSGTRAKPSTTDLAILTALNIAQELFEMRRELRTREERQKTEREEWERRTGLLSEVLEKELKAVKSL